VLSLYQEKSKKRKGVIRSKAEDYDKKEIIFEQSEKKKYINYPSKARSQTQPISRLASRRFGMAH
jgi:hypothetical protein